MCQVVQFFTLHRTAVALVGVRIDMLEVIRASKRANTRQAARGDTYCDVYQVVEPRGATWNHLSSVALPKECFP